MGSRKIQRDAVCCTDAVMVDGAECSSSRLLAAGPVADSRLARATVKARVAYLSLSLPSSPRARVGHT
jgi:hypothetical protein